MILPPPKSKVSLLVHILFLGRCGNPVLHDSSIQAAKKIEVGSGMSTLLAAGRVSVC